MSEKHRLFAQYTVHCNWFNNALVDLSDEECNQRVNPNMNHIKYIAGHLLNAQYGFAIIAGLTLAHKWDDLFAAGGKTKAKDNFPYPTIEEIKREWDRTYPIVSGGLSALSEGELQEELPNSPVAGKGKLDNTRGDLWVFLNLHQAYHIGQIGILRRAFGKDPMKYF